MENNNKRIYENFLILMTHAGNKKAKDMMLGFYDKVTKDLVISRGIEFTEEMRRIGRRGVSRALYDYKPGKKAFEKHAKKGFVYHARGYIITELDKYFRKLAKEKDLTVDRVADIMQAERQQRMVSLDQYGKEGDRNTLVDMLEASTEAIDDSLKRKELSATVNEHLSNDVDPVDMKILTLRFYHGMTLEQIGRRVNLTRERVRQRESKALRTLKFTMSKDFRLEEYQPKELG